MPNPIPEFQDTRHLQHYLLADESLKQEGGVVDINVAGIVYTVDFDRGFISTIAPDGTEQFFRNLVDVWSADTTSRLDGVIIAELLLPASTETTRTRRHPKPHSHRTSRPTDGQGATARVPRLAKYGITESCWREPPEEFRTRLAGYHLDALTQLSSVYDQQRLYTPAHKLIFSQRVLELSDQEFTLATLNQLNQLIRPFITKECRSTRLMQRIADQVLAIMERSSSFTDAEHNNLSTICRIMTAVSFTHPCLSGIAEYFSHNLKESLYFIHAVHLFRHIVAQHAIRRHYHDEDRRLTQSLSKMYEQLPDLVQGARLTPSIRTILYKLHLYGHYVLQLPYIRPLPVNTEIIRPPQPSPVQQLLGERLQRLLPATVFERNKLLPVSSCHVDWFCPPNIVIKVEEPEFHTTAELDYMQAENTNLWGWQNEAGISCQHSETLLDRAIMECAGYTVLSVSNHSEETAVQLAQTIRKKLGQTQSQGATGYTPSPSTSHGPRLETTTYVSEEIWSATPEKFQTQIVSCNTNKLAKLAHLYNFKQEYPLENKRLFCQAVLARPALEFQALDIRQLTWLTRPFLNQDCHSRHLLQQVGDHIVKRMEEKRSLTEAESVHLAFIYRVMAPISFEHPCLYHIAQHFAGGFDLHQNLNQTSSLHLFLDIVSHHTSLKYYNRPESRALTSVLRTMYQQLDGLIKRRTPLTMSQQNMVHWIKLYGHYVLGWPMTLEQLAPLGTIQSTFQRLIERTLQRRLPDVIFESEKRLPSLQFDVDLYCDPNIVIEVQGAEHHTSINLDLLQGSEQRPAQEQHRNKTSLLHSKVMLKQMLMEQVGYTVLTVSDNDAQTLDWLTNRITTLRAEAWLHQPQAQTQAQHPFQSEPTYDPGLEGAVGYTSQYPPPVPAGWGSHQFPLYPPQIPPGMQLVLGDDGQYYYIPIMHWSGQEPQE